MAIDPIVGGALVTGGASLIQSLINTGNQAANRNLQKRWQRKTWRREDNAIQRRVKDLKKAGLSPTLAAGNAAQASQPIKTDPVQTDAATNTIKGAMQALQMHQTRKQLSLMEGQKKLYEAQADRQKAEADLKRTEANWMSKEKPLDVKRKEIALKFMQREKKQGLRKIRAEIKNLGAGTVQKRADARYKAAQVGKVEREIAKIATDIALNKKNITLKEREIVYKEVATELARLKKETDRHNLDFYKELEMPTNAGFDMYSRISTMLGVTPKAKEYADMATENPIARAVRGILRRLTGVKKENKKPVGGSQSFRE